jgi:hypothetical protein
MMNDDDEYLDEDAEEEAPEEEADGYYDACFESEMISNQIGRGMGEWRELPPGWQPPGWHIDGLDDDNDDDDEEDDDEEEEECGEDEPWWEEWWDAKKTRELCRKLQHDDPSLTEVCTSIFQETNFASELGSAMVGNTQLRKLRLSHVKLSEHEAKCLAKGIGLSNLKTLAIHGTIQQRESAVVQQILYQAISKSPTIQEVVLDEVPLEVLDGLGDVLSALKRLELLAIENVDYWNPRYGQLFCDALIQKSPITSLTLKCVPLGDEGFMMLTQCLGSNVSLKKLELVACGIGDSKVRLLLEQWHPKSPLECLLLSSNSIRSEGAQLLFRAAAARSSLQELDLSWNRDIGFRGLKLIGEGLPAQLHLNAVNIKECTNIIRYDDETCAEAQKQAKARQQAQFALMNGMRQNQSITQITVEDPCDRWASEWQVQFYAEINRFGRRLLLSMNHQLAPMVWCHVLAKCQGQPEYATSFTYYFLCEQPTLVQKTCRKRRRRLDE